MNTDATVFFTTLVLVVGGCGTGSKQTSKDIHGDGTATENLTGDRGSEEVGAADIRKDDLAGDRSIAVDVISGQFTVTPEGGSFQIGPVLMEIPPGSTETEAVVTVTPVEDAPVGYVGTAHELSVDGVLSKPVTITFTLSPTDLPAPYSYGNLRLAWFEAGRWQILDSSVADPMKGVITGTTDHLSLWAVVPQVKVDMLWVIDNSASMCQETKGLKKAMQGFLEGLKGKVSNLDIQVAAVTTAKTEGGVFNTTSADACPSSCIEQRAAPCLSDEDCKKQFGEGWECNPAAMAQYMYNDNGTVNSSCVYRCKLNEDCCFEFCHQDVCQEDLGCLTEMCSDIPQEECPYTCAIAGGLDGNGGCLIVPHTQDCPEKAGPILKYDSNTETVELFECIATVPIEQSYTASMEQGLATAWLALDPAGPNGDQSAAFLRPDAFLVLVFFSDEDDCSLDEEFCSPNYLCTTDADCQGSTGKCKIDEKLSEMVGAEKKTCCGIIKKDYFNSCAFLGDFKGLEHHECAYDITCDDCSSDADCEYGWYCKLDKKCQPKIFEFSTSLATYQSPPGVPAFSLTPVEQFYTRFASLKSAPKLVLVGVMSGDGVAIQDEKNSYISQSCLDNDKLDGCQGYLAAKQSAPQQCIDDPYAEGCADFLEHKLNCIRDCYVASKGGPTAYGKNSYICAADMGKADWGARYLKLAKLFGSNGAAANFCTDKGVSGFMPQLVESLMSAAFGK